MELLYKAKAVRLRSHLGKYLVSDDDQQNIRQSSNASSAKAQWLVETVHAGNSHFIRLKNTSGKYLTASDKPSSFGMTGTKVLQTSPENMEDKRIEWEPIKAGCQVKLRGYGGKFLRANGGTPPWRNTVNTHDDSPNHNSVVSTRNWNLWSVEPVCVPENEWLMDYLAMVSSFSSVSDELSSLQLRSPVSIHSSLSFPPRITESPLTRRPAIERFHKAKVVRLRSHHDKYLTAKADEESVIQTHNSASNNAKWTIEFVEKADNVIRLKSCYGKYLTASNQSCLLGQKVVQTLPHRLDSSVEWEPIIEGNWVKLRTRYGQFLRGNGGLLPWRNSVTHDIPYRTATKDWILWDVEVVELLVHYPAPKQLPPLLSYSDSFASESTSPSTVSSNSPSFSRSESSDSLVSASPKLENERLIYYHLADEFGEIDMGIEGLCIIFKGTSVKELTKRLEDEAGLKEISVCSRSTLNRKIYPLLLQLPPNNATMDVIVFPSSYKGSLSDRTSNIPELNGSNFNEWKEQLEMTLECLGLNLCFRIDEPLEESVDHTTWKRSNHLSLMIMKSKIANNICKSAPNNFTRARDFLAFVEHQFKASNKTLASTLIGILTTKRYDGTSGVREHIIEMANMAEQLKSKDMTVSESFLVQLVLNSLPSQFDPFKISYNTNKDKWTIDELIAMCVQEEEQLKQEVLLSQGHKRKGLKKVTRKENKSSNHENASSAAITTRDDVDKRNLKCYFCKKKGHLKKDCQKRKN